MRYAGRCGSAPSAAAASMLRARECKDESTATLLREGLLPLSCVPVWLPALFCCTLKLCRAS